jgi:hypothetical protein
MTADNIKEHWCVPQGLEGGSDRQFDIQLRRVSWPYVSDGFLDSPSQPVNREQVLIKPDRSFPGSRAL